MAQIEDTLARSAGSEGASLASSLPIIISIIAVIIALLGLLLNCYKYWKDGHNLKKASWDVLGASLSNASRRLCQALDDGCEILKTILEIVASNSRYYSPKDYTFAKDNLRKVLSSFNEEYEELLSILKSHDSIEFDSDAYKVIRNRLTETIEDYSCDIHDIEYITKLAFGLTVVPTDENSDILKNILDLLSPSQNIADIIALRFDESFPRDYAGEVRDICGQLTEIARLPKKISNLASPLKTTYCALFGNPEQQYNLACLYLSLGKWAEAEKHFKKAIDRGHLEANYTFGRELLNFGKETDGLEYLKTAADEGQEDSIMALGRYYFSLDRFGDAVPYFSKLSENKREARFFLARAHMALRNDGEAISEFSKLVEEQNANTDIYGVAAMYHIVDLCLEYSFYELHYKAILSYYDRVLKDVICDNPILDNYLESFIPLQVAELLNYNCRYPDSLKSFHHYASKGFPAAECWLGWYYFNLTNREEREKNYQMSKYFFIKSASRHHPEAYVGLAKHILLENKGKGDIQIAYNYLMSAVEKNVLCAFFYLAYLHYMDVASYIGKGTKEKGFEFENQWHTGLVKYFYMSHLDYRVDISRPIDQRGFPNLDEIMRDSWWRRKPCNDFLDSLTLRAKKSDRKECENYDDYGAHYVAVEPASSNIPSSYSSPVLITIIRGHLHFTIYDGHFNSREWGVKNKIELHQDGTVKSVFLSPDQSFVIECLKSGSIYRIDGIYSRKDHKGFYINRTSE